MGAKMPPTQRTLDPQALIATMNADIAHIQAQDQQRREGHDHDVRLADRLRRDEEDTRRARDLAIGRCSHGALVAFCTVSGCAEQSRRLARKAATQLDDGEGQGRR